MSDMKNLFDPSIAAEMKRRVSSITPANERRWGKMTAPQALAHCAITLEWATDQDRPSRMFLGRLFGGLIARKVTSDDLPLKRNTPTAPQLVITVIGDERTLEAEKERVCNLIDRFAVGGPAACTTHPHTFFGPMTPEQWSILMYKHLDHHLRQFGA